MGYFGKLNEKNIARNLRQKGYSYSQILNSVKVSKSTLSRWCRDIILTPGQLEEILNKKIEGSKKGRLIGAKKQQELKKINFEMIINQAKKEIGALTKREKFIAGIALYLGDGLKGDMEVGFANSNPQIIKFMANWFRIFFNIKKSKFRGQIWIHDNQDVNKAKAFWSEISGIPTKQFYKTYISKNKTNSKKIRKNIHDYGVFSIRILDSKVQRRLIGLSAGILKQEKVKY